MEKYGDFGETGQDSNRGDTVELPIYILPIIDLKEYEILDRTHIEQRPIGAGDAEGVDTIEPMQLLEMQPRIATVGSEPSHLHSAKAPH